MSHYFEDIEHTEKDYFIIESFINEKKYKFQSCNNVFSKNEVDYGSKVLINTIIKNYKSLGKRVLDLGCGYGAIGISLADFYRDTQFVMSDVTKTATRLAKHNLFLNNIENNVEIVNSNIYDDIEGVFDYIITNPPIKVGKSVLHNIIIQAVKKLKKEGELVLVIKKKHGKDSIKKLMQETFDNVEVLKRDKGYYILRSIKYED